MLPRIFTVKLVNGVGRIDKLVNGVGRIDLC